MTSTDYTDRMAPKELIIPKVEGTATTQPAISGAIFMSGGKLYFIGLTANEIITSA